jgi:hypothetical protein
MTESQRLKIEEAADKYLQPYTDHCAVAKYCIHDIICAYKAGAEFALKMVEDHQSEIKRLCQSVEVMENLIESAYFALEDRDEEDRKDWITKYDKWANGDGV